MTDKLTLGRTIGVGLCLALCSGCVSRATVRSDPRTPVIFASATGTRIFYEAYITKNYTWPMGRDGYIAVSVPLQWPYRQWKFSAEDVHFNAAVAAADTNHDGVISDEEARHYSETVKPLPQGQVAVTK